MMGFDEREQCYLEDCKHEAACHESHWQGAEPILVFGACQVEGCICNQYEHDPWIGLGAKPPVVPKRDEPTVVVDRRLFLVRWDYKTLAVADVAGALGDQEIARLGREGYELIESRRVEPRETHYRFRKPMLRGVMG